jgi:hypothetical protein
VKSFHPSLIAAACFALGAAIPLAARADIMPETIGLNLHTVHSKGNSGIGAWNGNTLGFYAKWSNGLAGGAYRNSQGYPSLWAGYVLETPGKMFSITTGLVTGYERYEYGNSPGPGWVRDPRPNYAIYTKATKIVGPLVALSVRFEVLPKTFVRLVGTPDSCAVGNVIRGIAGQQKQICDEPSFAGKRQGSAASLSLLVERDF